MVACIDDTGGDALLAAAKGAMDASCKLPAGYESQWPQLVLATLDVNRGQYALPYAHKHCAYRYPTMQRLCTLA